MSGVMLYRMRLKIVKICCLYLGIFSCVKHFGRFVVVVVVVVVVFAFRLEMHVRCDNLYKTGTGRGSILGQLMLFECMGI